MEGQTLDIGSTLATLSTSLLDCWSGLAAQEMHIAGALRDANYRGPAADRDRARLRQLAQATGLWTCELASVRTRLRALVQRLEAGLGWWAG